MCINDNNAVINNNNYGRFQNFTLLFKTPRGTQENFFEFLQKIWACALKKFASPGLDHQGRRNYTITVKTVSENTSDMSKHATRIEAIPHRIKPVNMHSHDSQTLKSHRTFTMQSSERVLGPPNLLFNRQLWPFSRVQRSRRS